ncbi:hypothetical protein AB0F71_02635 [Kitasatospora sp. NPDC028055]|uniref:hypothetical protein n=1 Tax=Kitasatospora sp. NPDC028055 TaxID=3155653 RepID=UPI0033E0A989
MAVSTAVPVWVAASGPVAVALTAAGRAERELRLVEIGFVLFLGACATGALVLLGAPGKKGRRQGGG